METFKIDPEQALRDARQAIAATNGPVSPGPALVDLRRSSEPVKGAAGLMKTGTMGAKTTTSNKASATAGPGTVPVKPRTADELAIGEMEQRLAAISPATDDDLREFMQHRCQSVQKFLIDTGKVTAERVFLIAPKITDPTVQGAARVTFSLD